MSFMDTINFENMLNSFTENEFGSHIEHVLNLLKDKEELQKIQFYERTEKIEQDIKKIKELMEKTFFVNIDTKNNS